MALEEQLPAETLEEAVEELAIDEDEDDRAPATGPPSTIHQKRQAQKAKFDQWLRSDAAQATMHSKRKEAAEEVDNDRLTMQALINRQQSVEIVKNPRDYQLELFERAKKENTIAVLDTGSGKTLIAVLLLRWIIDQELEFRASGKPPKVAFFLVASVTLVFQQFAVLETNLDHKVARFYGGMNIDTWSKAVWDEHFANNKVIVCTADILLQCLAQGYITIAQINLLVFDEAHHTKKNHAYARIIKDYYLAESDKSQRPRVFGMTASPVDAKVDVDEAALELETLLHSRIATAQDMSLAAVLKKKNELVIHYGPLRGPFDTEFLSLIMERFGHLKIYSKIFSTARTVAADLGPWCADHYLVEAFAEKRRARYEAAVSRDFLSESAGRPMSELDNKLEDVDNACVYASYRWKISNFQYDQELSAKVENLVALLSREFERPTSSRCLVFCDKRHTARLLALAFQRRAPPHLKVGFLIGAGNSDIDEDNFTVYQQAVTMADFRTGKLNCLFATSVAEEGLDVPDCNLVIRFDLYKTMVQYVQSRGRARQDNSKFIHMVERNNSIHNQLLSEVRLQEQAMKNFCNRLPEDRLLDAGDDVLDNMLSKEKAYRTYMEPSTKAKLTYNNCLVYLANFVSAIPTDDKEPQHPTFVVTSSGSKFVGEVLLPPTAPINSAVGLPHTKKSLAKRAAAFEMCLQLRKKAYLDQHFLPTYVKKLPALRNALMAVNTKKTYQYIMRTKPEIWEQTKGIVPTELYVTVITFPNGLGRRCRPLALLTKTPLPQLPVFSVFLNDGTEAPVKSLTTSLPVSVDEKILGKLTKFTLRVFNDVFGKEYEEKIEHLSYWLAPTDITQPSHGETTSTDLDRQLLDEVAANGGYKWTPDMPPAELLDRFIWDKWDRSRRFFSQRLAPEYKPTDPVPEGSAKISGAAGRRAPMMKSILEYSNAMFKNTREKFKDIWDLDQPVFQAEKIPLRRNYLATPNTAEFKDGLTAYLCPQPLVISVLPAPIAASCLVWPAIIWRIESYLIAIEAAQLVGVSCDPSMALEAVTKDSDNSGDHHGEAKVNFQHGMGNNYERLEFIGDTFLKTATTLSIYIQNPNDNEFDFHVKRGVMLQNKNLFEVAKQLKLYEFVRSKAFSRRLWYPEGMNLLEGRGAKTTEEIEAETHNASHHNLGDKTIADVCEAMIGAAFVTHDKPGAWDRTQWDDAVRAVTKLVGSEDHLMMKWDDYQASYELPAYQVQESTASQRDMAEKVELEHPYHFIYPRLLRSAFLHPSQPFVWERVPNYQRLEFLGDALLDMASICHIFYKYPDKDPQWLTEHKMAMIGNRCLGMIAVTIGFHKHLRHHHNTIEHQIRDYATELMEAKCTSNGAKDYWVAVSEPPKCLADIVEAYIGAMFIDSGFDYNTVQNFFDMHIQPHFEDLTLYDTYANNHPCTHLHNLLDTAYGCQDYRLFARELPAVSNEEKKEVVAAVMIHDEVIAHSKGKSGRYARLRAAKLALEKVDGLAPYEYRARFGCNCAVEEAKKAAGDGEGKRVNADCGV